MRRFLLREFKIPSAFSRSWGRSHLPVLRRSGRCVCVSSVSRGRSEIQNKQKQMCLLEMSWRISPADSSQQIPPPPLPLVQPLLPDLRRVPNTLRKTAALVPGGHVCYIRVIYVAQPQTSFPSVDPSPTPIREGSKEDAPPTSSGPAPMPSI